LAGDNNEPTVPKQHQMGNITCSFTQSPLYRQQFPSTTAVSNEF